MPESAAPPTEPAVARALVLAPTGRDGQVLCAILARAGFDCGVCSDATALTAQLDDAAVAIVAEEALSSSAEIRRLRGWLEEQPAWSDFPFVLLSLSDQEDEERRRDLRDALGNVTILERPARPDTIARAAVAAARARSRQRDAARLLEARARAEAQRHEGERRLRELYENAVDAIFIAGGDGRLSTVNPAACDLLGRQAADLLNRPMTDFLPVEEAEAFARTLQAQQDGRRAKDEWRLVHADGSRIDVEISSRRLDDGRWQAFARDIRDRK